MSSSRSAIALVSKEYDLIGTSFALFPEQYARRAVHIPAHSGRTCSNHHNLTSIDARNSHQHHTHTATASSPSFHLIIVIVFIIIIIIVIISIIISIIISCSILIITNASSSLFRSLVAAKQHLDSAKADGPERKEGLQFNSLRCTVWGSFLVIGA